jgi:uncharacterized repeat protein (TIGR01451 family)
LFGGEILIRKFVIRNNINQSINLNGYDIFGYNPQGLGLSFSNSYIPTGTTFIPLEQDVNLGKISLALLMGAIDDDGYLQFYQFANFLNEQPYTLEYSTDAGIFYRICQLSDISKTELTLERVMNESINIDFITPWFRDIGNFDVVYDQEGDGKIYQLEDDSATTTAVVDIICDPTLGQNGTQQWWFQQGVRYSNGGYINGYNTMIYDPSYSGGYSTQSTDNFSANSSINLGFYGMNITSSITPVNFGTNNSRSWLGDFWDWINNIINGGGCGGGGGNGGSGGGQHTYQQLIFGYEVNQSLFGDSYSLDFTMYININSTLNFGLFVIPLDSNGQFFKGATMTTSTYGQLQQGGPYGQLYRFDLQGESGRWKKISFNLKNVSGSSKFSGFYFETYGISGILQVSSPSLLFDNTAYIEDTSGFTTSVTPSQAYPLDDITYNLSIPNKGKLATSNLKIQEDLPTSFQYIPQTVIYQVNGTRYTCSESISNNGSSIVFTPMVGINPGQTATVSLQAEIPYNATIGTSYQGITTISGISKKDGGVSILQRQPGDGSIITAKSVASPNSAYEGDNITVTLTLSNTGNQDTTNLTFTPTLSSPGCTLNTATYLLYINGTTVSGNWDGTSFNFSFLLHPDDNAKLIYTYQIDTGCPANANIVAITNINSGHPEALRINSNPFQSRGPKLPDFSGSSILISPNTTDVYSILNFTLNIINSGLAVGTNIQVSVDFSPYIPPPQSDITGNFSSYSVSGSLLTLTIASLDSGQSTIITFPWKVPQGPNQGDTLVFDMIVDCTEVSSGWNFSASALIAFPHYWYSYIYQEEFPIPLTDMFTITNDSKIFNAKIKSPILIQISAVNNPIINPSWEIYSKGELIGNDGYFVTIPVGGSLLVSSFPENQYAILINEYNNQTNIYQQQDMTKSNFVTLAQGENDIRFNIGDGIAKYSIREEHFLV